MLISWLSVAKPLLRAPVEFLTAEAPALDLFYDSIRLLRAIELWWSIQSVSESRPSRQFLRSRLASRRAYSSHIRSCCSLSIASSSRASLFLSKLILLSCSSCSSPSFLKLSSRSSYICKASKSLISSLRGVS